MTVDPDRTSVVLRDLLEGRRTFVPIARAFVQQRQRGGGAGPLAGFVRARRHRALNMYLLMHAVASRHPYDVEVPAAVWMTALGLPESESSRVSLSTNLTWLESQRLIRSEHRRGRRVSYLLADNGSGETYRHDPRSPEGLDYFKLPYEFWHEGWHLRLSLPGLAVLLIGLSLPAGFLLPQERAAEWYGISRDTVRRGIDQLRGEKLIEFRTATKRAPQSPIGISSERRYKLRPPFAG